MAQRTPASPGNRGPKSSTSGRAPARSGTGSKSAKSALAAARSSSASSAAASAAKSAPKPPPRPGGAGPAKRPPSKPGKPGRSIVNQKTRPWGLIVTAVVIVLLAAGVIGYATLHHGGPSSANASYVNPEIADAKAISGVIYKAEPNHTHVEGNIAYNSSPPVGGNHSQFWADCSGTVYPAAIANENAVHMLEHGAVWITYKPGLPAAQITTLSKLVKGVDRMAMSPYPDLKTNISLQAWDYQLFVDSASDPRIAQFILALRFNPKTTPETSSGVTCSNPQFLSHPSTFGHPLWVADTSAATGPLPDNGSASASSSATSSGLPSATSSSP